MSEPGASAPLSDAPRVLVVEGILDGRVMNEETLRQAVEQLGQCGAGSFRVDITGGRFSMLPVETHVPPTQFDTAAQSNFLDRLQAVADAAQPSSVETNLRCKLIYEQEVAETLFIVRGGRIEPVTRRRPITLQDAPPLPTAEPEAPLGLRRREVLWLAPMLLVIGALFAWQSGWIDRVLAARAEQMATDPGAFGDMLHLELERSWGNYYIKVQRGPGYPATPEALTTRRDRSADLTQRAACELVGNGGELFVQLVADDGKVLTATRIELRPLLTDEDGEVIAKLPGHMSAKSVKLSLSSGQARSGQKADREESDGAKPDGATPDSAKPDSGKPAQKGK